MGLFSYLFSNPPEPTAMELLEQAVDDVNNLLYQLPDQHRRIRPFVRSGNFTQGTKPKLLLGYWDMGKEAFVVTYEGP